MWYVRPTCQTEPIISPGDFASVFFLSLMFDPNFSGTTAASLDPVTTTLADMQTCLRTLIKTSTSIYTNWIHIPEAVAPMLHRHGTDFPPLTRTTPQTWTGMAYTQVGWPRHPGLGASWAQFLSGRTSMHRSPPGEDQER